MYSKLLSRIIRLIEYILMVLLGVALIIITLQVFFRYILAGVSRRQDACSYG